MKMIFLHALRVFFVNLVAWLESYHTVKNKLTDGVDLRKRFFKSVSGLLLIRCCKVKRMAYGRPSGHIDRKAQIQMIYL